MTQETQILTNPQKMDRLKAGCKFKMTGSPMNTIFSTENSFQEIYVSRNGQELGFLQDKGYHNLVMVEVILFGHTNHYPIDLSQITIL